MSQARARPIRRALALLAAAPALAALCACGDDQNAVDAGVPVDARPVVDATWVACSPDAGCDTEPHRPVCDLERGACVECLSDEDCSRSASFGPVCDERPGYCRCATDADCDGNANGPVCDEVVGACTCLLDGDCANGQECTLEPYLGSDVRTCRQNSE